jgi:hypothetical protein
MNPQQLLKKVAMLGVKARRSKVSDIIFLNIFNAIFNAIRLPFVHSGIEEIRGNKELEYNCP